jgi:hypothetical protein
LGEQEATTTRTAIHPLLVLVGIGILALVVPATAQQQQQPPPQRPPTVSGGDFTVSAQPESLRVRRGSVGRLTVTVKPVSGFKANVRLVSSLLYGTTITFDPATVEGGSGSSTLTVAPGVSAIKGAYVLTITAIDGGISHMITVPVTLH